MFILVSKSGEIALSQSKQPTTSEQTMFKLNSYSMPIHTKTGATVCTPDNQALKQRVARLKGELRNNLNK